MARRALVLRSTWISSLMGDAFRSVLAGLLNENRMQGQVDLEWLSAGMFLQYPEIAGFDAAIFFPEQPDKLTFWEQYEMAMPLWLPSVDFWTRIHAVGEFRYSVFASRWFAELPEGVEAASSSACALPLKLFFQASDFGELARDSPITPAFWFHLTDYAIFPHLQLFSSAAELIEQLLSADLVQISSQMAAFNVQTWQKSATFYLTALCALLGSRADGTPLTPQFMPQPTGPDEWASACAQHSS
ncbi:unnamed protein product [Polarella glacialis]|uniref:Uncharacterized protein n=1 Tax=Polarella glacialis TaxID=89957 RepID=A0A813FIJ8_POLGL|nr:unnamed protein product [Polarella glacialis]